MRLASLLAIALAAPAFAAAPAAGQGARGDDAGSSYVVRRGQTLSAIAQDVLGDGRLWPAIYRANRDQIMDPTRLHVGQRLSIPALPADPEARERIRAEALAFQAPARGPAGPDVAAARAATPSSATE
jgi:Tfp pilus assembly protein FimV